MSGFIDRTGRRFGRLTVLGRAEPRQFPSGQRHTQWFCQCDCGARVTVIAGHLRTGETTSCGCLQRELAAVTWAAVKTVHGLAYHPLHPTWASMLGRCNNPNAHAYEHYGGRGIEVCERWSGPEGFPNFLADMGERPPEPEGWTGRRSYWSLDRIDNDGDYEPGNVRWATAAEQRANQRAYAGRN